MTSKLHPLQILPGIGVSIAKDLVDIGINNPKDLKGKDPEKLYQQLCVLRGTHLDRCLLYTFRCAVYAAETNHPEPKLLKWWNWSDAKLKT